MTDDAPRSEEHPIDRYIAQRRVTDPRYSKQALADEAGVSRVAIHRVISGDDAVSIALLEKLEAVMAGTVSSVELLAAWKRAREPQATTF
jgi:predicted transcriptional regulator